MLCFGTKIVFEGFTAKTSFLKKKKETITQLKYINLLITISSKLLLLMHGISNRRRICRRQVDLNPHSSIFHDLFTLSKFCIIPFSKLKFNHNRPPSHF